MKNHTFTAIALATGLAFSAGTMAESMSRQDYKQSMDRIESDYRSEKSACDSLSGNAKDICVAEAKGKEKIAKANLEAASKNSAKARYDARIAKADADYAVAKEKCDDLSGNDKDVCIKKVKAAETSAKADAKAQMKTSAARKDADEQASGARRDADADKRDAAYSVAKEKCDSLAGAAKENCVNKAKMQYGK